MNNQKNNLDENNVYFFMGSSYKKTDDGFIISNYAHSVFFSKNYDKYIDTFLLVFSITAFCITVFSPKHSRSALINNIGLSAFITFFIYAFRNFVKVNIIVNPKGVEIKSKRNRLFIDRKDIEDVYVEVNNYDKTVADIFLKTYTNNSKFNLFGYQQLPVRTAYFLLKKFIITLDLDIKDLDVKFE